MTRLLPPAALFLLTLLAACAAPQQDASGQKVADNAQDPDVVCFFEAPTGTNRKVRRCMSKEDYNKSVETAQRTAGEIKMPPPLQR